MKQFAIRTPAVAAAIIGLSTAGPAFAELPVPVRDMVQAAIDGGDADTVKAVISIARQTNPEDGAELDALQAQFDAQEEERVAEEAAAKELAIREGGLFDNWSGKGEIGAFQSTGNSDNLGVTASLTLKREGIDWSHRLRAAVDYQRTDDVTTREQFVVNYEPRYQISRRLFAYALGQFERDRLQGFSARYAASGGLGYKVIDGEDIQLSMKAGPAWRRTEFIGGGSESSLAVLAGLDFDWAISDGLTLTQNSDVVADAGGTAVAIIDGKNTSINLVTGLEAAISDALTARLSYTVEYDSNPPAGAVSTDTLTRFTVIYGF